MNWRRGSRVIGIAAVLNLLVLALMPAVVFANHTSTVTNTPLGAALSTLTTFTLGVTVVDGNKEVLQVDLVVDASWTVPAAGAQPAAPTGWTIDVAGSTITWTTPEAGGYEIIVTGSENFSWNATTASSVEYSSHSWTTTDNGAKTFAGTVGTAVTNWESYLEVGHSTPWGTAQDPYAGSDNTAFMYGEGFETSQLYHVGFYDPSASPNRIASTDPSSTAGALNTSYLLSIDLLAEPGTWHAVVYKDPNSPPDTYNASDLNIVADDDFVVSADAIPEFPTVLSALASFALCGVVYFWMRKKAKFKIGHQGT